MRTLESAGGDEFYFRYYGQNRHGSRLIHLISQATPMPLGEDVKRWRAVSPAAPSFSFSPATLSTRIVCQMR